jgi:hypothetical protein
MARAPWIQRLTAACAALVVGCALLAPPASLAAPRPASGSPAQEIATGSALVGVVPYTGKRSAEGTLVALRSLAAPQALLLSATGPSRATLGGEAPALVRWRLAHGTSTASP